MDAKSGCVQAFLEQTALNLKAITATDRDHGRLCEENAGGWDNASTSVNENGLPDENNFVPFPRDMLKCDLMPTEKVVWCAILNSCDNDKVYTVSSIQEIADSVQLSRTTVFEAVQRLEHYGLVSEQPLNGRTARVPHFGTAKVMNNMIKEAKAGHG